ncbi:hypothetical protein [Clostridium perfringens]|nr:hypothetical protein [Clostridium perfringens]
MKSSSTASFKFELDDLPTKKSLNSSPSKKKKSNSEGGNTDFKYLSK